MQVFKSVRPDSLLLAALMVLAISYCPIEAVQKRDRKIVISELRTTGSADYTVASIQGDYIEMQDTLYVERDIGFFQNMRHVDVYAVFDGHGGQETSQAAKDIFMPQLTRKILAMKKTQVDIPNYRDQVSRLVHNWVCKKGFLNFLQNMNRFRCPCQDIGDEPIMPPFMRSNLSIDYKGFITAEIRNANWLIGGTVSRNERANGKTQKTGSTVTIAIRDGNQWTIANLGDSRGILVYPDHVVPVTVDHLADKDIESVENLGGTVTDHRVGGILAVSRALGDREVVGISCEPDTYTFTVYPNDPKGPKYLLLASDGIWDNFDNQQAADFLKNNICDGKPCIRDLVIASYDKYGETDSDNISAIYIDVTK